MPRVPTYDTQRVGPQALRTPQIRPTGPLGLEELGAGISRVAGAMNQIAQEEYAKAAAKDATDGESALEDVASKLFYDAKDGLFNQRGEAAFEAEKSALETFTKERDRIAQGLRSERAREMFNARSAERAQSLSRQANAHVARERAVALKESSEARIQKGLGLIAQGGWRSNDEIRDQVLMMSSAAAALASSDEGKIAAYDEARQRAYSLAIGLRLDNGDVRGAKELLDANEETLGQYVPKLRERLEKEAGAGLASSEAAQVLRGFAEVDPATRDVRYDLQGLRSVLSGDQVGGPVRKVLEERVQLAEGAMKARALSKFNEALALYQRSGTLNSPQMRALEDWFNDPKNLAADEWDKIKMKARQDNEYVRRKREGRSGETDEQRNAMIQFRADLVENHEAYKTMTPEEFSAKWIHKLSAPDYEAAGRLFAGSKKEDPVGISEFKRFVEDEIDGTQTLRKKSEADKFRAKMGRLRRDFMQKNNGREPDLDDLRDLKAKAFDPQTVKGIFFDSKVPAYQIEEPAEAAPSQAAPQTKAAPKTSEQKRARIIELKKQGRTPDDVTRILNEEGY